MIRVTLLAIALSAACLCGRTSQAVSGTWNAPPNNLGDNQSLDSNSTLNVSSGGSVGIGFRAGVTNLPNTNHNIVVNIMGGSVGDVFYAGSNSTINISGGTVGDNFYAEDGSKINISGGSMDQTFRALSGSIVTMSGGTMVGDISVAAGAQWIYSGGVMGQEFIAQDGSAVSLLGGEFLLNGVPATTPVTLTGTDVLSGTLQDGTPFIFSKNVTDWLYDAVLVPKTLPTASTTPITVNSGTSPLKGLRAGQKLTLGGGTLANNFAVVGATLNINSGTTGYAMEVSGSTVNISGGNIGAILSVYNGSTINISGGSVGERFDAYNGSHINISGGKLDGRFQTNFDSNLRAEAGSTISVSGGSIPYINARTGSAVTLHGGEFLVNGAPATSPVTLNTSDVLTATLADGSVFIMPRRSSTVEFSGVTLANQALPALDLTPKTISSTSTLQGLRAGQSLSLNSGGSLPTNFNAVSATMKLTGGTVGTGMKTVNTSLTLAGGSIGDFSSFYTNTNLTMTGGSIGQYVSLYSSTAYISGGTVGYAFSPNQSAVTVNGGTINPTSFISSTVNFRGGTLSAGSWIDAGSTFNLSGGTIGNSFNAAPGTTINVYGTEFDLGFGASPNITNNLTLNTPYALTDRTQPLHGKLADGSSFSLSTDAAPAIAPTANVNLILVIPGDFNYDGAVDSADYIIWRQGLGTTYTMNDLNTWRSHFGQAAGSGSALGAAVPEPRTTLYGPLMVLVATLFSRRRA